MKSFQLRIISTILVLLPFCCSLEAARMEFSTTGYLPSLRLSSDKLQSFIDETLEFMRRAKIDTSQSKRAPTVTLASEWNGIKAEGSTLNEIFSLPDCPDPLRNLLISLKMRSVQSGKLVSVFMILGPIYNHYSLEGADQKLVYALEAHIVRFADQNSTWIRYNYRDHVIVVLYALAFLFIFLGVVSGSRLRHLTVLGLASAGLGLITHLSPVKELFTPLELWRTSEVSFFVRYAPHIAFWSLVIGGLALVFAFYVAARRQRKIFK